MTTRNFRVHNGISVGDIVISASTNKITGGATAAPSADGDFANKKYVDDQAAASLTLTNKTLTSPVLNTAISGTAFLDEDNLASDSATKVASQQSIKAYVDAGLAGLSQNAISQLNTNITVTDSGSNGAITFTADGNSELVINDTAATFSGNVVVTGNLTTNGTTVTNSSTNTTIEDALIELGSGNSGSNANDLGLILERGSTGNNGFMGWDESEDKFIVGTTTGTGSSTGNLTVTTGTLVANIEGNVTGNVTGDTSGSSGSCTGLAATATALASTRAIGGVNFNGTAPINLPGVNIAGNQNTSGTAAVATAVTAADESSDTSCNVLFVTAATGDLGPKTGTNLTFNSSAGTLTTTTFVGDLTGTATAAEYSDVAERFASDTAYAPGTVVALGGAEEITQVNEEGSDEVFGVISSLSQAAFKMNGGAGNDATHPYIAMTGRVNVKVIGSVSKGDRLISASVPGYAKAAIKSECTAFNVIGRALTSKTEAGQGTVLAAVRVSH